MVINDPVKFKFIAQLFFLLALLILFVTAFILKRNKVEITYHVAINLLIFVVFPIIMFPFLVYSDWSIFDKITASIIGLACGLLQFYGIKAFHKMKKTSTPSDKA
jgi:cytochrome bd-type quinol oxidase subunit 2